MMADRHHDLIQGPLLLIEYDNTQGDAHHVHCIYRDFDHDFADAMLQHDARHYGKSADWHQCRVTVLERFTLF